MKEIRIKYDDGISDELASLLIRSVINQGKISNNGKSYCYVTTFKVNGMKYDVVANDKTKSIMFYVNRSAKLFPGDPAKGDLPYSVTV